MGDPISPNTLLSHYRIISKLGAGGMGEVYLAEDTKLDRKVAIKFLHQEFSKDEDKLKRFVQEAKTVSALNHPNILTVHEIGEVDGKNYISTELIDGQTLRRHLSQKEPLSLNVILKIGVQVAEALSAAHHAGIVHRDIKPENIMIRTDGYAKVLDFGLAKLAEPTTIVTGSEDKTRAQVNTSPGTVMGTATYMSPEQARGKATDARTDVWSLGVVLYEMIARKVPFSGETINHTIVAILEKEPLLLENAPAELQRIVRKSLTKDVEMRYQSARDLLIDLKNLRRDLDIQGEIERSVVPNREPAVLTENETRVYAADSLRATKSGRVAATQNVSHSSSSLEYAVTQAKSHKLFTTILGIALLGVFATVGYFAFVSRNNGGSQITSIAVLPFENRSGNPDSEYLSDGLAESLIYRLSQLPNLKVSPTSSIFRYKGKEVDIQKLANELGVQAVMSGRVVQRGENLAISVELIDARNNKLLWGEQYERRMSDLLTTQREIVAAITEKLQLRLSGDHPKEVASRSTENNEAYQLYLKGRFYWNKRSVEALKQAAVYYIQAIEKDPGYALAYSGLAETYVLFPVYSVAAPRDSMPQAKAAALKALAIDDSLAEAHAALGLYLANYAWDPAASEKELRRAIELKPNYATAHHWLGNVTLLNSQRFEEAIAAGRRAEELDPLSAIISADTGLNLLFTGRYDEAIAQLQRTLALEPNFYYARYLLGWAYYEKGMYREAISAYRKSLELNPDPYVKSLLALALSKSGGRGEAIRLRDELAAESARRYLPHYYLAIANLAIGERDAAFAHLEKEIADRGSQCPLYAFDPLLDEVRSDPRFSALVEKIASSKID